MPNVQTRPALGRLAQLSCLLMGLAGGSAALAQSVEPLSQAALAQGAQARSAAAAMPTDRLIIKYRSGTPAASLPDVSTMGPAHAVINRSGAQMRRLRGNAFGAHVMKLDRPLRAEAMRELARQIMATDANVEYAEADERMRTQLVPNDSFLPYQWHYWEPDGGIGVLPAWDLSTGRGVVVAVVDTGYRPHIDLAGSLVAGYDFIARYTMAVDGNGRDNDASDPGDAEAANECYPGAPALNSSWHGTHVAGTIAARTNNHFGAAGVAFNAKVLPVRVLGKCGGFVSDIADGIVWAAGGDIPGVPRNATPARVINLSLGGFGLCGNTYQFAVNAAGRAAPWSWWPLATQPLMPRSSIPPIARA